jgi:hypothetical protein
MFELLTGFKRSCSPEEFERAYAAIHSAENLKFNTLVAECFASFQQLHRSGYLTCTTSSTLHVLAGCCWDAYRTGCEYLHTTLNVEINPGRQLEEPR